MKLRYKFLLYILLLALPAVACGEDVAPTSGSETDSVSETDSTNETDSAEIESPTLESPTFDPTSEPTLTPTPILSVATITGSRVNIRSGPGTNYPILQTLDQNDTAPATGFNSGETWVQIELPDSTIGWVSADLVDVENSDELSVVADIPLAPVATTSSQQPASEPAPLDNDSGSSDENSGESSANNDGSSDGNSGGSSADNGGSSDGNSGESSADNGGSSDATSGGNGGNAFQCAGGCATPPDPSCTIKGNVNSSGERIYHVVGGSFYNRTDIKPEEGDRWFCTTPEAEAAGFRQSSR